MRPQARHLNLSRPQGSHPQSVGGHFHLVGLLGGKLKRGARAAAGRRRTQNCGDVSNQVFFSISRGVLPLGTRCPRPSRLSSCSHVKPSRESGAGGKMRQEGLRQRSTTRSSLLSILTVRNCTGAIFRSTVKLTRVSHLCGSRRRKPRVLI